ncbi:CDP-diacylglycerol--glycerol-3-phosphate 3-phosphatidyltransferase [Streptomyces tsukubensis]|uniref:CDP-diacylglycerol--glycerol-3-phosphate 3-phosphatidyltransferase n=1 Tax=Streptomyces tsukubensis TaxID=83656 RepID=A0A1V3ZZ31_9ACTN|nr:CDP-diacylglycerol--glycerol-3-phosphate 3-phosphatidyltransferase [Streptomyces tsukubensis]OON71696.1 CDP-diacylglycerol--glycerol-3-phosphate 3-phosphatidyltransferase [Streptomyces tsukubensis]QFR96056.1 CDP-diacylglycerol--glycerol-3-phosphate 3-phosphatidyltransferase [Streptomyces tsukubensis]
MTGVPASAAGGPGAPGAKPAHAGRPTPAVVEQAGIWNIANILTMIRLLLVPGFVALMLADGGYDPVWRSFAWAAFAVAMITDLFDGHLARTYNLVTDFGKIADPIADKAIMGAALICLSSLGDLPWWVTGVILGREIGITLLRFVVIRYGVIPASRGGKLKTLTQGIAVGMYVLALVGPLASMRFWVMAVAVALTVVTGLDYVKQAIVLRRRGVADRDAVVLESAARLDPVEQVEAAVREEPAVREAETAAPYGARTPVGQGDVSASAAAGATPSEAAAAEPASGEVRPTAERESRR